MDKKVINQYVIADIKITMATEYKKTTIQAKDYLVVEPDWSQTQADAWIEMPEGFLEEKREAEFKRLSLDNVEYICTGSLFSRILLRYNGLMIHSSAIVVDGYAYLFSANSGTGKSTHTSLWKEYFGDKAFIINDDKPAIRKVDGEWYVYGTPWSGKTDLNVNTKAKLGAIVFLERSKENRIEELDKVRAVPKLIEQTARKLYKESNMNAMLDMVDAVINEVPMYKMGCNISNDAVITAYEKIRKV